METQQTNAMGYPPQNTPWGSVQTLEKIADGIYTVTTASHGGIWLSAERREQILNGIGSCWEWFEEDCEWAIPAIFFRHEFYHYWPSDKADEIEISARKTLLNYNPKLAIPLGLPKATARNSIAIADREFYAKHTEDYIAVAAWGPPHKHTPAGFVLVTAIKGGRKSNGQYTSDDEKQFLVPEAEYETRDRHGFIVDPAKYPPVEMIH